MFCFKMFRWDVVPRTGTHILQRVVSVETSELLTNVFQLLVHLTHQDLFSDPALNKNVISLGCKEHVMD